MIVAPCEFLIVGELTKATEKIVSHLSGTNTTVLGDTVRVERIEKDKKSEAEAFDHVSKFYADKVQASKGDEAAGKNSKANRSFEVSFLTGCRTLGQGDGTPEHGHPLSVGSHHSSIRLRPRTRP